MCLDGPDDELERLVRSGQPRDVASGNQAGLWTPAADVFETAEAFVVRVELPGLARDQMAVEVRGRTLWVYGRRHFEKDLGGGAYQALERSYGPFARRFALPKGVVRGAIRAVLKDGLLEVVAPRERPEKIKRRIPIS